MSSIQEQYESLSYPHYVHSLSDPARLSAIGQILGLKTSDPGASRVLDIGCGAGTNLLAMAARMPGSRFLGLDFSAPDIASAQALAAEAGLVNVEFRQTDLMAWQPHGAKFDTIIAYGFFSWVPDEVKDRLLHVVAECLAPQGLACISYMTYPGCKQPEALRDLLRLRTEARTEPAEKVALAHATLDFLDRSWQALPKLPHSGYLREEVRRIRVKEPNFLLLDDLGVERDPCYLLQFTTWAAEHGLKYLGESEFHTMLLGNLPATSARELAAMQLDQIETEQMLDYVTNRAFRCTLLVGPEAQVSAGMHAEAMLDLCFASKLRLAGKQKPGAAEGRFEIERRSSPMTLRSVPLVAFVRTLVQRKGALTPYREALADAQQLAGKNFTEDEEAQLCEDLLALYGRRALLLSSLPFIPVAEVPERPRLTPLNFALARHRTMVITAFHDSIRLNAEEQACCSLLDGTRTLAELRATEAGKALGVKLEPYLQTLCRVGAIMTEDRPSVSSSTPTS